MSDPPQWGWKKADLKAHTNVFRLDGDYYAPRRDKVQKRPGRPTVNCLPCRTRKMKCDRGHPCSICVKRGDECTYTLGPVERSAGGQGAASGSAAAGSATAGSATAGSATGGSTASAVKPPRQEAQERLSRLESMVHQLLERSGPTASRPGGEFTAAWRDSNGWDDVGRAAEGLAGLQNMSGDIDPALSGVPFAGATSWHDVLNGIRDVQGYLSTEAEPPPSPPSSSPALSPEAALSDDFLFPTAASAQRLTQADVLAALPPRAQSDAIMDACWTSCPAPFLHQPSFRRAYASFYADPSTVPLLWTAQLAALLSMGVILTSQYAAEPSPEGNALAARLRAIATRVLVSGDYLSAPPGSVEAILVLCFAYLVDTSTAQHPHPATTALPSASPRGSNTLVPALFTVAARLAQQQGYHRDASRLPPYQRRLVTPFQAEMRRRIWYVIEAFDLLYSFNAGVPTVVHDGDADAAVPLNLLDTDFDTDTRIMPASRPWTQHTPVLYPVFKVRLVRLLRGVSRLAQGPDAANEEAVKDLDAALRRVRKEIPPSLKIRKIRDKGAKDSVTEVVQRLTLEVTVLKSRCVLYRVFLTHGRGEAQFEGYRRECRNAALGVLELHLEFEHETGPDGVLARQGRSVVLSSLTTHDFLLAATILCLDLSEGSGLSPEDKAKELDALQKVYKIWEGRKRTSKDAAHAARVMGAIIRRVSAGAPQMQPPKASTAFSQATVSEAPSAGYTAFGFAPPAEPDFDFAMTDDLATFDEFLNDPTYIDWDVVDSFLRDRTVAVYQDDSANVWSADLMRG